MAYAATITVERQPLYIVVTISETEATSTSEATLEIMPKWGALVRQAAEKTAGSCSTIDPLLGTASDPSGTDLVYANGTAAADLDNLPAQPVPYFSSDGTLYHRSQPNSGSDNSITTKYYFLAKWRV